MGSRGVPNIVACPNASHGQQLSFSRYTILVGLPVKRSVSRRAELLVTVTDTGSQFRLVSFSMCYSNLYRHVKALESCSSLLDAALASADEADRRWEERKSSCRSVMRGKCCSSGYSQPSAPATSTSQLEQFKHRYDS